MNKYAKQSHKAQKARLRWRMCERKVKFPTEEAAYQKGQQTYRCRFCGQWHRSGSIAKLTAALRKGPLATR